MKSSTRKTPKAAKTATPFRLAGKENRTTRC